MKNLKSFLLHFLGWLLGIPVMLVITFSPLICVYLTNNPWYFLIYLPVFAFLLALKTMDEW